MPTGDRHGRCLFAQGDGLHDLARVAITALRNILRFPGTLHRMTAIGVEALDNVTTSCPCASARFLRQERTASPSK